MDLMRRNNEFDIGMRIGIVIHFFFILGPGAARNNHGAVTAKLFNQVNGFKLFGYLYHPVEARVAAYTYIIRKTNRAQQFF